MGEKELHITVNGAHAISAVHQYMRLASKRLQFLKNLIMSDTLFIVMNVTPKNEESHNIGQFVLKEPEDLVADRVS